MSKLILSPKYGLNTTMPVCFFCGKPKNEIALLGKLKGDVEAPREAVLDYIPCEACQKAFGQGVLIVGVTKEQPKDKRPPIQGQYYPTGSYVVATEDFVRRLYGEQAEEIIKYGKCLMEQNVLTSLQSEYEAACREETEP